MLRTKRDYTRSITIQATEDVVRLAKECLAIQNACNLCGLAQRFAKVMTELLEASGSTVRCNEHPITVLWLDKFASLSRTQEYSDRVMDAYDAVYLLRDGKDAPWELY